MTTALMVLTSLCVVLVGLSGWLFGKAHMFTLKIDELEAKLIRASKENELLFDTTSQLSMDCVRLGERIDMLEDKFDDAENRITAQVAEKVEKRWDAGLEKMMAWNPYDNGGESN